MLVQVRVRVRARCVEEQFAELLSHLLLGMVHAIRFDLILTRCGIAVATDDQAPRFWIVHLCVSITWQELMIVVLQLELLALSLHESQSILTVIIA